MARNEREPRFVVEEELGMDTPTDGQDFLRRVALGTLQASKAGLSWKAALGCGLGGALLENALGPIRLEAIARQVQELGAAQRQEQWREILRRLERCRGEVHAVSQRLPEQLPPGPLILPPAPASQPLGVVAAAIAAPPREETAARRLAADARWRDLLPHPCVVLIVGGRNRGKSGLGYYLLELFPDALPVYVVGVPEAARDLLPDWVGIAPDLEDVPCKAVALVDEAYLLFHARSSMAAVAKRMSEILNLSRQREQTWIFVTQEARQVDRNIVSAANVVIFKPLGLLQAAFERAELSPLVEQANEAFATVKGNKRRWAYVVAPEQDFQGLLENPLPSFWSPRLSRLFAQGAPGAEGRPARRVSRAEKMKRAQELRARGESLRAIAKILGVSPATVVNYLKGYPGQRKHSA